MRIKSSTWIISLLLALLVTLTAFAGMMYILDPLLQYGKESPPLTYYSYKEMYSNPGIAMHYDYDTVLVGTSMIENTDVDEFDELMQTKAVRLPYAGGTALDMKTILDVCFSSDNSIHSVFWALDEHQLFSNPDETRHPLPKYLYSGKKLNFSYLLNLDIFAHYALHDIIETLHGNVQPAALRGETFQGIYGKEAVLESYHRAEQSKIQSDKSAIINTANANLTQNIEPLLEANPDTHFIFYFVPYSILYWDSELRTNHFDAAMAAVEYVIGELLTYDNVTIYFYHDEEDIITNLDNYKDYSHYAPQINSYVTQAMASEKNLMTVQTYKEQLVHFWQFVYAYDYDYDTLLN